MTTGLERTVLAIYFDKNKKVVDKAVYSAADGKTVTVESRRTQSFGEDRTFIDQILQSF
jgi:outer membrane protein assembly factor BamE (lipoprotein component of BamABCDE complex)